MKLSIISLAMAALLIGVLGLILPLSAQSQAPPPSISWEVKAPGDDTTDDIAVNAAVAQDWLVENNKGSDEDVDVEIYEIVDGEVEVYQTVSLDPGETKQVGLQVGQSMRVKDPTNQGDGAKGSARRL